MNEQNIESLFSELTKREWVTVSFDKFSSALKSDANYRKMLHETLLSENLGLVQDDYMEFENMVLGNPLKKKEETQQPQQVQTDVQDGLEPQSNLDGSQELASTSEATPLESGSLPQSEPIEPQPISPQPATKVEDVDFLKTEIENRFEQINKVQFDKFRSGDYAAIFQDIDQKEVYAVAKPDIEGLSFMDEYGDHIQEYAVRDEQLPEVEVLASGATPPSLEEEGYRENFEKRAKFNSFFKLANRYPSLLKKGDVADRFLGKDVADEIRNEQAEYAKLEKKKGVWAKVFGSDKIAIESANTWTKQKEALSMYIDNNVQIVSQVEGQIPFYVERIDEATNLLNTLAEKISQAPSYEAEALQEEYNNAKAAYDGWVEALDRRIQWITPQVQRLNALKALWDEQNEKFPLEVPDDSPYVNYSSSLVRNFVAGWKSGVIGSQVSKLSPIQTDFDPEIFKQSLGAELFSTAVSVMSDAPLLSGGAAAGVKALSYAHRLAKVGKVGESAAKYINLQSKINKTVKNLTKVEGLSQKQAYEKTIKSLSKTERATFDNLMTLNKHASSMGSFALWESAGNYVHGEGTAKELLEGALTGMVTGRMLSSLHLLQGASKARVQNAFDKNQMLIKRSTQDFSELSLKGKVVDALAIGEYGLANLSVLSFNLASEGVAFAAMGHIQQLMLSAVENVSGETPREVAPFTVDDMLHSIATIGALKFSGAVKAGLGYTAVGAYEIAKYANNLVKDGIKAGQEAKVVLDIQDIAERTMLNAVKNGEIELDVDAARKLSGQETTIEWESTSGEGKKTEISRDGDGYYVRVYGAGGKIEKVWKSNKAEVDAIKNGVTPEVATQPRMKSVRVKTEQGLFEVLKTLEGMTPDQASATASVIHRVLEVVAERRGTDVYEELSKIAFGAKDSEATKTGKEIVSAMTEAKGSALSKLADVFEGVLTPQERREVLKWSNSSIWTETTSEAFKNGFEKYLREGIAPEGSMQGVFDKMVRFFSDTYKGIDRSGFGVALTKEMRDIYDMMSGVDSDAKAKAVAFSDSEKMSMPETVERIEGLNKDIERLKGMLDVDPDLRNDIVELRAERDKAMKVVERYRETGIIDYADEGKSIPSLSEKEMEIAKKVADGVVLDDAKDIDAYSQNKNVIDKAISVFDVLNKVFRGDVLRGEDADIYADNRAFINREVVKREKERNDKAKEVSERNKELVVVDLALDEKAKRDEVNEVVEGQIKEFGVDKASVKPVRAVLEKLFDAVKKMGATAAKDLTEWVGIGKGKKADSEALKQIIGENGEQLTVRPLPNQVEVVNGFYSPIEKALVEIPQSKGTAKQFLAQLKKAKGVKADELNFTGIEAWLESQGDAKITKQDILDYMKENRIEIVEVVKGGVITRKDAEKQGFKIEQVGDKWVATAPNGDYDFVKMENSTLDALLISLTPDLNKGDATKFSSYQLEGEKENYKEILVIIPKYEYVDSHWDGQKGIIVWIRANIRKDADGDKVLFVEEFQSGAGQKGKKEGFALISKGRFYEIFNKSKEFFEGKSRNYTKEGYTKAVLKNALEKNIITKEEFEQASEFNENIIPTAPFVTNTSSWVKLGIKTAIKEAVAQGATKIAWTTGEQQFERWGSEKIDWVKTPSENYEIRKDSLSGEWVVTIDAMGVGGKNKAALRVGFPTEKEAKDYVNKGSWQIAIQEQVSGTAFDGMSIDEKALSERGIAINSKEDLKAAIDRTLSREKTETERQKLTDRIWERMQKEDKGTSLPRKEGMEAFYDDVVAKQAKAVVKELTGKEGVVGETKLETAKDNEYTLGEANYIDGIGVYDGKGDMVAEFDTKKEANDFIAKKSATTQQSIEITPELRAAVGQGMPLFQQANAQYRIQNSKNIIESLKDFDGSPKAVTAIVHEIMHPTVVEIFNGTKEGNEIATKHANTVVSEYNKANPKSKITLEQMLDGNERFKNGETTEDYRKVQEFIAEAWERYHLDGKQGFSKALQDVLDAITEAFKSVYSSLSGKELTPELRKMFNELLGEDATERSAEDATPKDERQKAFEDLKTAASNWAKNATSKDLGLFFNFGSSAQADIDLIRSAANALKVFAEANDIFKNKRPDAKDLALIKAHLDAEMGGVAGSINDSEVRALYKIAKSGDIDGAIALVRSTLLQKDVDKLERSNASLMVQANKLMTKLRGIIDANKDLKEGQRAAKLIVDEALKSLPKDVSASDVKKVVNRAAKFIVKGGTDNELMRFAEIVSRVVDDAQYAKRLNEANDALDNLIKVSGKKRVPKNYKDLISRLSVIEPSELFRYDQNLEDARDRLDEYTQSVKELTSGIVALSKGGKDVSFLPDIALLESKLSSFSSDAVDNIFRRLVNSQDFARSGMTELELYNLISETSNALISERKINVEAELASGTQPLPYDPNAVAKRKLALDTGVSEKRKMAAAFSSALADVLPEYRDLFTEERLKKFDTTEDVLAVGIAMQNYILNGDTSGLLRLVGKAEALRNAEEFKAMVDAGTIKFDTSIQKLSVFRSFGQFVERISRGKLEDRVRFLDLSGYTEFTMKYAEKLKKEKDIIDSINKKIEDIQGRYNESVIDQASDVSMAIYSYLSQPPKSVLDADLLSKEKVTREWLDIEKQNILQTAKTLKDKGFDRLSETVMKVYEERVKDLTRAEDFKLSDAQKELYNFIAEQHKLLEPSLQETLRAYDNIEFSKVDGQYTAFSSITEDKIHRISIAEAQGYNDMKVAESGNFLDRQPERALLTSTGMYNLRFKSVQTRAIESNLRHTILKPSVDKFNTFIGSKDVIDAIGYRNSRDLSAMMSKAVNLDYERKKSMGLGSTGATTQGERARMRLAATTLNKMQGLTSAVVFGNPIVQTIKQSTVLLNTITDGLAEGDGIRGANYIKMWRDLQNDDARGLLNKATIGHRDTVRAVLLDATSGDFATLISKNPLMRQTDLNKLNTVYNTMLYGDPDSKGIKGLIGLKGMDSSAAKASFLYYYKLNLKKRGVDVGADDFWQSQRQNPDKRAIAFATERVNRNQNVSMKVEGSAWAQDMSPAVRLARVTVFPFLSFALNKKATIYNDMRNLGIGTSDALSKDAATRDRGKAQALEASFHLAGHAAELYTFSLAGALISSGFGTLAEALSFDEEDYRDLDVVRGRDRFWTKVNTQAFMEMTPFIVGQPSEAIVKEFLNELAYWFVPTHSEVMNEISKMSDINGYTGRRLYKEFGFDAIPTNSQYNMVLDNVAILRPVLLLYSGMETWKAAENGFYEDRNGSIKYLKTEDKQALQIAAALMMLKGMGIPIAETGVIGERTQGVIKSQRSFSSKMDRLVYYNLSSNEDSETKSFIDKVLNAMGISSPSKDDEVVFDIQSFSDENNLSADLDILMSSYDKQMQEFGGADKLEGELKSSITRYLYSKIYEYAPSFHFALLKRAISTTGRVDIAVDMAEQYCRKLYEINPKGEGNKHVSAYLNTLEMFMLLEGGDKKYAAMFLSKLSQRFSDDPTLLKMVEER